MSRDDGGSVYPIPPRVEPYPGMQTQAHIDGATYIAGEPGMSLRDYFAAKALPEVIRKEYEQYTYVIDPVGDKMAKAAYSIADAMLKARQQ